MIDLSVIEQLGTSISIRNPVGKRGITLTASPRGPANRVSIYDEEGELLWERPQRKPKPHRVPVRDAP